MSDAPDDTVAYLSIVTRDASATVDPAEMGVAVAAVLVEDTVYFFTPDRFDRLGDMLSSVDRVVGVNDFAVEALASEGVAVESPYHGLQALVSASLGERVTLANVARATLGAERPEMKALPLEWREGNRSEVRRQLKRDVRLLRALHERIETDGAVHLTHPETLEETRVAVDTAAVE